MILLNFSHPLTAEHLAQIEALAGEAIDRVVTLPVQFDVEQPFASQVVALVDAVGLTPDEWQTLPILVNPPALNAIAVTLLAELHGRMGHFPAAVRLRRVEGSLTTTFEVAELIGLQAVREAARRGR
jgi:hypothetical protein